MSWLKGILGEGPHNPSTFPPLPFTFKVMIAHWFEHLDVAMYFLRTELHYILFVVVFCPISHGAMDPPCIGRGHIISRYSHGFVVYFWRSCFLFITKHGYARLGHLPLQDWSWFFPTSIAHT